MANRRAPPLGELPARSGSSRHPGGDETKARKTPQATNREASISNTGGATAFESAFAGGVTPRDGTPTSAGNGRAITDDTGGATAESASTGGVKPQDGDPTTAGYGRAIAGTYAY